MKIKQLFLTREEREIELDTPAFFNNMGDAVAVYSEEKVITAMVLSTDL
jgi:hypothetical protein